MDLQKTKTLLIFVLTSFIFGSCEETKTEVKKVQPIPNNKVEAKKAILNFLGDSSIYISELNLLFTQNLTYISDGFGYPLKTGKKSEYTPGKKFKQNFHLGEDCGGKLGTPIVSVSNGIVVFTKKERKTWGNIVRIVHSMGDSTPHYVESLYAHLDTITVKKGDFVKRGQKIGTMGNSDNYYETHLHFEIRKDITVSISHGYAQKGSEWMYDWFYEPSSFIKANLAK